MYTISAFQKIPIGWHNGSMQKPSKQAVHVYESNAADILKNAHTQTATVWMDDFHNVKQVLAAMKKRVRRPSEKMKNAPADIQTALHAHCTEQTQQSHVLSMLAVEIGTGFQLSNPCMSDAHAVLADAHAKPNDAPFLLLLNQFLGFIGVREWHEEGTDILQPGGKIHVPFGVLSPLRGEYLDLIIQAPLSPHIQMALGIGTGPGVIAAILAKRGIPEITAVDINPKVIACVTTNLVRLGLDRQVAAQTVDLFLEGRADLIACNSPWLPAKPIFTVETALYDPDNAILTAFLNDVRQHLNPRGEAWLIISDLAEYLHLYDRDFLE